MYRAAVMPPSNRDRRRFERLLDTKYNEAKASDLVVEELAPFTEAFAMKGEHSSLQVFKHRNGSVRLIWSQTEDVALIIDVSLEDARYVRNGVRDEPVGYQTFNALVEQLPDMQVIQLYPTPEQTQELYSLLIEKLTIAMADGYASTDDEFTGFTIGRPGHYARVGLSKHGGRLHWLKDGHNIMLIHFSVEPSRMFYPPSVEEYRGKLTFAQAQALIDALRYMPVMDN